MPALDRRPSCSRVLADVEMAALEGKLALLESQRQLSAVKCRIFVDMMESTMQCAEESTIEKYAAYSEKDTDLSFEVPAYEPYSKRDNGLARTLSSSGAKQHAPCERLRATNTARNSNSSTGGGGGSSGDGRRAYEPFAPPRVDSAYRRRSIDVPSVSSASARCASWRVDMIFYTPSASGTGSPARPLSRRRSGSFRAPGHPRGTPDAACAEPLPRDVSELPRGGGETRRAATAGRRSFQTTRELRYGQGHEDRCAAELRGSSRSSSPASASSASPSSPEASARLRSPWTNAAGPFDQLPPVPAPPDVPLSALEPTQNGPCAKEETSKSRGGSWRRRAQPKAEQRAEKAVEVSTAQEGKPSAHRDRRRMSLGGFASSLLGDLRYR
ncbi:unnamed protein product [Closterium sp. Naga37s-1]|nr:unnamed protein product [Closterium sp. Naga37s-1]